MKQVARVKDRYPNALVFFKVGDFYEAFNDDARTASKLLDLPLTQRLGTPMTGVPYHEIKAAIERLSVLGETAVRADLK